MTLVCASRCHLLAVVQDPFYSEAKHAEKQTKLQPASHVGDVYKVHSIHCGPGMAVAGAVRDSQLNGLV